MYKQYGLALVQALLAWNLLAMTAFAAESAPEMGKFQTWVINKLATFPVFFWLFTIIATALPLLSFIDGLAKGFVKATTWTKKDDKWLKKIEDFFNNTPIFRQLAQLSRLLRRFSLFRGK